MPIDRMPRVLVAAAMFALAAVPAFAADFVVVESSDPGLAAGTALAADKPLDIADKARVVLMSATGQMQTISGPFKGPPPAAKGSASNSQDDALKLVSSLMAGHQENQLGAVRDVVWRTGAIKSTADALAIDASSGHVPDMCVFDVAHAEVIHDPKAAGAMTVQSMGTGAEAKLQWQKDTLRQPWPAALPVTDGDILTFTPEGGEQVVTVTIHVLPPATGAANDVQRALQMARAGCEDQAKSLLVVTAHAVQ
jgi:hypothetical protein